VVTVSDTAQFVGTADIIPLPRCGQRIHARQGRVQMLAADIVPKYTSIPARAADLERRPQAFLSL